VGILESFGYNAVATNTKAEEHGSQARRQRRYWSAFLGMEIDASLFQLSLSHMKIEKLPLDRFLGRMNEPFQDREKHRNTPKEMPVYEDHHLELYTKARIPWPPSVKDFEAISPNFQTVVLETSYFTQRQREMLYLLEVTEPYPDQFDTYQFVAINMSSKFLVGEAGDKLAYSVEPPTLTTSIQIFARSRKGPKEFNYCLLLGHTLLEMIGLPPAFLREKVEDSLATHLAGNAFSLFGIGPVFLASLVSCQEKPNIDDQLETSEIMDGGESEDSSDAD
jgi:hypothetical protein